MNLFYNIERGLSVMERYRYQWIIWIALSWALIDAGYWSYYMLFMKDVAEDPIFSTFTWSALMLRLSIVFFSSLFVGYFLIFVLKERLRKYPLWLNILLKIVILLVSFATINILLHFTYSVFSLRLGVSYFYELYFVQTFSLGWILKRSVGWVITYLLTQLLIDIYEKYSPGLFLDVILGKYINPREEKRIIMFLDLKDSTTIAEQLGHKEYFKFIRDFIYYVSTAMLEYNAHIYQYVGDEIVVSWTFNRKNTMLCLKAVIAARKVLHYHSESFRRKYNVIPEFKAGIHVGIVTIGEIGAIKKDLAMSGDTMNTAARIRTACNEFSQKFIVSGDFLDLIDLKEWQAESLGNIELRGKREGIELFALKM